jgi:hypothetical protein
MEIRQALNIGSRHPAARLDEDKVRDIRRRLAAGETTTAISKMLVIGFSTVADISKGRTWSHVQ